MKTRYKVGLVALGSILLLAAVASSVSYLLSHPPKRSSRVVAPEGEEIDLKVLAEFGKAIGAATKMELYEGLPHPYWEKKALAAEVSSKQTFELRGYHYYQGSISPTPADAARLLNLASSSTSIIEWRGFKSCGGYHPDWLMRWTGADASIYEMEICFGCGEARLRGPKLKLLCDLSDIGEKAFEEVLPRYTKNRPKKEKPGRAKFEKTLQDMEATIEKAKVEADE